jgi:signal transduction histidine kinase
LIIQINDSLFNKKQSQEFQNIDFNEQQRLSEIEDAKTAERAKFRTYVLVAGLVIFLFIVIMLYRNSLQRKKANILLSKQKSELEATLGTLKTTQNQLVQSEKMASLGELTAGIAHEIQNPLNFVNNFAEVNAELVDELKEELTKDNKQQAIYLANDIKENEEKIMFHGKRADAIVKSMLQHSRSGSEKKEPTDINALADEYLRLAYHGMKAKDKSFNVDVKSDFDNTIEKVNVIQQDIGRVILNLITNAFYVVTEKKKLKGDNYEPIVTVSTKKTDDKILISVSDNGNGVPKKVLDKIFQPFFTTKPAGQGTGLGLSLSYDIITKGHGGELKVETREGEGSVFIISLPVNNEK